MILDYRVVFVDRLCNYVCIIPLKGLFLLSIDFIDSLKSTA